MSAQLNALHDHLKTKVAGLTDTFVRLEADFWLNSWLGAAGAYENATGRGPTQYAIGGRSFQFSTKAEAKQAMDDARNELNARLDYWGGTTLVDFGGTIW